MNAIKLFSVDLATGGAPLASQEKCGEWLEEALRSARKNNPRLGSTYAFDARHIFVIVKDKDEKIADIWGLTYETCGFLPNHSELHICAGAGALIRNLALMAAK